MRTKEKINQLDITHVPGQVLLSKEFACCGDYPMLVKLPETLTCQICNQSYLELIGGVKKSYWGFARKQTKKRKK